MKKSLDKIKNNVYEIPDFPKKGIIFRDITPLFLDPKLLKKTINEMVNLVKDLDFDVVISPESRGYLFGLPLAIKLKKPFVMVRKPNKLPRKTFSATYDLEYGKDKLEIHQDDIRQNQKVLIVDDVLATGGTIGAIIDLVKQCEAKPVGTLFLIELIALDASSKINIPIRSLLKY